MLEHLQPERVFYYFEQLCRIPHGSGHTEQIGIFCLDFAERHHLSALRDGHGNVLIRKPGNAAKAPVILQGHMDMVCVAQENADIDFLKDALPVDTDGDSVFCRGTSLGADDGIAVAMILALLEDDLPEAPPIEALFTTDEETGMFGAAGFNASLLRGKRMLNLDSEAEGVFWVSCAGGERVTISCDLNCLQESTGAVCVRLSGLQGGHSGTEIHKGHLNAVRCMAQLLKDSGGMLASLHGGNVDNAIPDACEAVYVGSADALYAAFERYAAQWRAAEPALSFSIEPCAQTVFCADREESGRLLSLLLALPCGVQAWSTEIPGLVETSLNLGVCRTDAEGVHLHFSVRSSVDAERYALIAEMEKIAAAYGARVHRASPYPAWEYRKDSPLRDTAMRIFADRFGRQPEVQAVHAGLECGIFAGKIQDLDCISIGPDIFDIHSPQERLSVASTERTYLLVRDILSSLD